MLRNLVAAAVCIALVNASPAAELTGSSGRSAIETRLLKPADLDFGGRQSVTVKELLDELHKRHGISICFDMPTFAALSAVAGAGSPGQVDAYAAPTACIPLTSPYGLAKAISATAGSPLRHSLVEEKGAAPASALPPAPLYPVTPYPSIEVQGAVPASAQLPVPSHPATPTPAAAAAQAGAPAVPSPFPNPYPNPAPAQEKPASSRPLASAELGRDFLEQALKTEINVATIDFRSVSVATALRIALESVPTGGADDGAGGMPMPATNAALLDYVVENDDLLVTSRLRALASKETRVYSIKHLKDIGPDQLATVIKQSIRPWSWRSRIDDLGEKLRSGGPRIPAKALAAVVKSGVQLASAETGIDVQTPEPAPVKSADSPAATAAPPAVDPQSLDDKDLAQLGDALANGLVTFVQASLTTLEIMHYADPPTGSIQVLPGKLVITQSQAAHHEIAELLKELAEE